jgi:hypothetical protein
MSKKCRAFSASQIGRGAPVMTFKEAFYAGWDAALAEPEPYDQQALELCEACGWKTLIPTEGCLNCERQPKAEHRPPNCGTGFCSCIECPYVQPAEQEPVAWYGVSPMFGTVTFDSYQAALDGGFDNPLPLYAAPQPRRRLTDEEIDALELPPSGTATVRDLVRIIEAAIWSKT